MGKLAPAQGSLRGVIVYGHEGEINVLQIWNIERSALSCTVLEFSLRKRVYLPIAIIPENYKSSPSPCLFHKSKMNRFHGGQNLTRNNLIGIGITSFLLSLLLLPHERGHD
jgi:hypothetical protein